MYSSEKELVKTVINVMSYDNIVSKFFSVNASENIILEEVNLGFGIADIVLTGFKSQECRACSNKLDYISLLALYHLIENQFSSLSTICASLGIRKTKLNEILTRLECNGYVEVAYDKCHVIREYHSSISYSCAIEAKLKNWKRALRQAYRYKWFSERAFVCMPEEYSKPAKNNLIHFKDFGVGLFTINFEGHIDMIYDPGIEKPVSPIMNNMLNEIATTEYAIRTC
jgi:hypothetical protein